MSLVDGGWSCSDTEPVQRANRPLHGRVGWFESSSQNSPALRQSRVAIYALFIFLLVPTARFVPLQVSPLLMLWLLHAASRRRCP